jgi:uncharacterized radical SAM protein YgiQ
MTSRETTYQALPMTRDEMAARGWDELDILLITGDAYIDHPAFGVGLLGRWLEAQGYRVGVVAQPRWDSPEDVARLGRPRLFAGVASGAVDSMLAHYTAFRKKRSDDAYTPGGMAGARPNRAVIVYTGLVRQAFKGLPVVIGGIEASLRRATHYDFWTDGLRRSILLDSKADVLVYGMGERAVLEVARRCECKEDLRGIPGTAFAIGARDEAVSFAGDAVVDELPSHEAIVASPDVLMDATLRLEQQVHEETHWAVQQSSERKVVFAPPAAGLTTSELDALYALPYTRGAHPLYTEPIPALEMIQFSITSHRGCGGGCSFCSLALHQGRRIRSRSGASLAAEVGELTRHPDWKGSISDVGGPSANMWGARCTHTGTCTRTSCLTPDVCAHFRTEQAELGQLLKRLAALPGVKHLSVASGIRHDLAMINRPYVRTLLADFVGGQLKLAPEHCAPHVLEAMRKPSFTRFEDFLSLFEKESRQAGKRQFVVPYLMSAFPGCTDQDMRDLSAWLRAHGWWPQQVQCFIPTPGTVATAMYYIGKDAAGKGIHVARSDAERIRQHRILVPVARHKQNVRPE